MFTDFYDIRLPGHIFILLTLVIGFVLIMLFSRRKTPAVRELIWLMAALFIWSFGAVFESGAKTLELRVFWSLIAYVGTVYTPVLLLLFIQEYSNYRIIQTSLNKALLFIPSTAYFILALTNGLHLLVWPEIVIQPETNLAVYGHGIAFWIFYAYAYVLIALSWVILIFTTYKFNRIYRAQALIILMAVILGVVGNVLYLLPFNPIPGLDWTLIGLFLSVILITYDIFRLRLFDLVPTARKTLMDIMDEGMLFLDDKGRILDMNASFAEAAGIEADTRWLGMPVQEVFYLHEGLIQKYNESIYQGKALRSEITLSDRIFSLNIRRVSTKAGQSAGRLFIINDISSLKETQNHLFVANARLNKEVRTKQQLIDELDTYAHTVAHDLKTPLGQMAGFSELILEEIGQNEWGKVQKYSQIIFDSSMNLVHIVDELLLLASVRSSEIRKEPVDMKKCVEAAIKRLDSQINERAARIVFPDEWPSVLGYLNWIQEVFVNYLSNAIKYGGDPPVIEIEAFESDGKVWYAVTDNGDGIPEKMKDRLFIAFSRLETTKADGHGLGLSIVKRIMDKLDGEVRMEDAAGKGARFMFGLPPATIAG